MAHKVKKTLQKSLKKKSASMTPLRKMITLVFVLFIMSFLAARTTLTTPISANAATVLGDDDDEQEEENEQEDRDDNEGHQENEREDENEQEDESEDEQEDAEEVREPREFRREQRFQLNNQEFEYEEEVETEDEKPSLDELRIQRKMDIRTSDGYRIKSEIDSEGKAKLEMRGITYRYTYELENGRLKIKVKNEQDEDIDLPDEAETELEDSVSNELEEDGVEFEDSDDDSSRFSSHGVRTRTHFPLSIDPVTHQLIVTTPAGVKFVAVLPDQAIQNLIEKGVVDVVASDEGEVESENQESELIVRNGEAVYRVEGTRRRKFFGLIPFNLPVVAYVSAEDGTPTEEQLSILTRILDTFSL